MKYKQLAIGVTMAAALLTSACGGGSSSGTGSSTSANGASSRLSGTVAKGVVQKGLIIVSEWVDGKWVARAETHTDDNGSYSVELSRYQQGPLKISALAQGATRMKCDAALCGSVPFGELVDISASPTTFQMDTIIPTLVSTPVPVTPYTHMLAAHLSQLASAQPAALTSRAIVIAGDGLSQFTGFPVLTTAATDVTDAVKFAAAEREQQLAGLLGAAVIKIANSHALSLAEVLEQLASGYQNGQFDADDPITVNTLLDAWRELAADPQLQKIVSGSDKDVLGLLKTQLKQMEDLCQATNSCAPTLVDNSQKSDLQKAKELVSNSRSFIYNLIETDTDQPLKSLGSELNQAFFDRNAVAMSQLMGTVVGKVVTTLVSDKALQDEIVEMRKGDRDSVVRTIGIQAGESTLGSLTLTATQEKYFKVVVTGSLQGDKTAGREVTINLAASSNFDLLSLLLTTAANETFTLGLSGTIGDSTTQLTIQSGEVQARIKGPVSSDSDSSLLASLSLRDLTLSLQSATAAFLGRANIDLVAVDKSQLSSYFYDNLPPLSLTDMAMGGELSTATGSTIKANFDLSLNDADKLDLLAFLNDEEVVDYKRTALLSKAQIRALRAKSMAVNVPGSWAINYGESNLKESSGVVVHQEYADSLDVAQELSMVEEYGAFNSVFDLVSHIKGEFASFPEMRIQKVRMHVTGKGDVPGSSTLSGKIKLGPYETDKHFLKAELTSSFDVSGVEGLPEAKLSAWVKRDKLHGGSLNLLARWAGDSYNFYLKDLDLVKRKGALTVSDRYGCKLVLDSINFATGKGSGAIYVSGKKMADVETVKHLLKISYIDGYFETLQ
ncbi:MAG: hypothetical protein ACRCRW_06480 [Aeromonadaceae bacterium]